MVLKRQAQSETVLADALSIGKHELFLVRDTEGTAGVSTLHGFVLGGAAFVAASSRKQAPAPEPVQLHELGAQPSRS